MIAEAESWDTYEALVASGLRVSDGTSKEMFGGPGVLVADYRDENGNKHLAVVATANHNMPPAINGLFPLLAAAPAEIVRLREELSRAHKALEEILEFVRLKSYESGLPLRAEAKR